MEFRILGPLEVVRDGRVVPLGGPRQRALLALLLIRRNRVVSTSELIRLLWRDQPPHTARNTLQVFVSHLRRVLEPHGTEPAAYSVLQNRPPGYRLTVSPEQLDLNRFERLVGQGRTDAARGNLEGAVTIIRRALSVWRGDPLADVASEPFAIAELTRLNEVRLQTLEDCIDLELTLGRHPRVVAELEALLIEHPLRERLCSQLMLALYRCGQQAEASAVFYKMRQRLVRSAGIEPGPHLQQLLKDILRHTPSLA